ncbi:SDR family NAD(P)-dependent oxidoreductase, partial [Mesorhizobium sp. M7D.F.Ca.US.004.03.1.1]|uniref:SDR family NAD(P)-dependent oxidoreductase n=1 Tax=Mesorhizobium sp. M7D.F.Ca.US.004.03.1.1 TaxID=2496702 RepID=UPI000FCC9C9D
MAKATLLISGANRGLGLEMARQFTADGWEVHGTVRRPGPSVSELASTIAPQRIHLLEAADPNSVAQLAANLRRIPFDAVFANAGMTGDTRKRPDEISFDDIAEVFAVNTFGALSLVRALKPN